jgi:uncharacterized RDD family membrane protein YckC
VTKTCLQCGAVLPSSVRACIFCEIASTSGAAPPADALSPNTAASTPVSFADTDAAWRDELALRLENYRGRKKKPVVSAAQSQFSFEPASRTAAPSASRATRGAATAAAPARYPAVAIRATNVGQPAIVGHSTAVSHTSGGGRGTGAAAAPAKYLGSETSYEIEPQSPTKEEFSFTIAIGRPPTKNHDDNRMVIDVSLPPEHETDPQGASFAGQTSARQASGAWQVSGAPHISEHHGLFPAATIEERRIAAAIDGACLLFAFGAFLALFSAVGGVFTASKLSGAVCLATFAIVYLQYFAIFTIFGGTTPGMMLRNLQVVSFTGEPPSPRQMMLRSAGYVLSAGTMFLGFLWSMWDEDTLTWHDRISRTYLHSAEKFVEVDAAAAEHSH